MNGEKRMIEIINGYKYDTDKAIKISKFNLNGEKLIVTLYVIKLNKFFVHQIDVSNNGEVTEYIKPFTKNDAIEMISKDAEGIRKFEELFGEFPEAPGEDIQTNDVTVSDEKSDTVIIDEKPHEEVQENITSEENGNQDKVKSEKQKTIPLFKQIKLYKACEKGDYETAEHLISSGAVANQKAFHKALQSQEGKLIDLLLKTYSPVLKDYLYSVLLGNLAIFQRVFPMDNKVKMEDVETIQMYAGKYGKNDIMQYINQIISYRMNSIENTL